MCDHVDCQKRNAQKREVVISLGQAARSVSTLFRDPQVLVQCQGYIVIAPARTASLDDPGVIMTVYPTMTDEDIARCADSYASRTIAEQKAQLEEAMALLAGIPSVSA